jgi:hypothetical protein
MSSMGKGSVWLEGEPLNPEEPKMVEGDETIERVGELIM